MAAQEQQHSGEEVSLKQLITTIIEYFKYVVRSWKTIAIISAIFIAFFWVKAYMTPFTYPAGLTFIVNEDESNGMSGLSNILGGLKLGKGGDSNLSRILELAKTRKIIQSVILSKKTIKGKEDYIGNFLIDLYDYHEQWSESSSEELKTFLFTHDSVTQFNIIENIALKSLYSKIVGSKSRKGLFSSSASERSGIMTLAMETLSPDLSIAMVETLYDNLSNYYVEKTVSKQQQTYDLLKVKADSILNEIQRAEYNLAAFADENRGLWSKKDQLTKIRLERNLKILAIMYGEVVKNVEIAEFTLKSDTPYIQEVDRPIAPISPLYQPKIRAMITGLFIGIFLAVVFLVGRKIITEAMEEE